MINSTLSDRLRRMESALAVAASRAKVETVVGILEAGARASPAVFLEAPPYGLFMGFGDGNLNFRSCAWINRHEDAMCIASSFHRAVLAHYDAAGILIPDPLRHFSLHFNSPLIERIPLTDPAT